MNIQKPPTVATTGQAKPTAQTQGQSKTANQNAGAQSHKAHHFQAYMSADGRPKEAFHPYRDINQTSGQSSALLARNGIVRPLAMASLPMDPTKRGK